MSLASLAGGLGSGIVKLGSTATKTNAGASLLSNIGATASKSGILGTIGGWVSKFLGGGSNSSGNIYEGILAGLGGAASSLISKESVEEQGKQQRKTLDFQMALEDYYNQKDKVRKRAALDTYGQFSTMNRWAPNATPAPPIDMPNKPGY